MAKQGHWLYHLLLLVLFINVQYSIQLQASQFSSILRIHQILNYSSPLTTDFCNTEPSPSLTLVCYQDDITQLHIGGTDKPPSLPEDASTEFFLDTIVSLSSLKVLSLVSLGLEGPLPSSIAQLSSLEILNVSSNHFTGPIPVQLSSLKNLQTLILDYNNFTGQVPAWLGSLSVLTVLSLKSNSVTGFLPNSIKSLENLRILALSGNQLFGAVPDLHNLTNLQVLDLEGNRFGPSFPSLPKKVLSLVLRNNKFQCGIPDELVSQYQLQRLDISLNEFVGPFSPSLLSLPSLNYLDIGGNKLTGMLLQNISCSTDLAFVNLSSNLLTGKLPTCLESTTSDRVVLYGGNCLSDEDQEQNPSRLCHNEALAVKILPHKQKQRNPHAKALLDSSTMGGILGGITMLGLVFLFIKKVYSKNSEKLPQARSIVENVFPVNEVKLLSDARYISDTMKLGASLPAYRAFSVEELKEATNNFDASSFMSEVSQSQLYRGKLPDETLVAIKCLKLRKKHILQSYTHHIEQISKLRHTHLASALGHCLEVCQDDSNFIRMYLICQFVPNGTLRDCIAAGLSNQKLNWKQRIGAAIGVAKGIQFLHTGIVPGVFSNNLKITDVSMDNDLRVKINGYSLTLLSENKESLEIGIASPGPKRGMHVELRQKHQDRGDVYDLGVILLEIIVGRPIMSQNEVSIAKDLLRVSMGLDDKARRSIADPAVQKESSDESLKTMMDICLRCLSDEPSDRPSVEDVLWNLQYAAQVQDLSQGGSDSIVSSSQEL
ncbi:probable inactive leucine-rich repeat receptor-like protein kinase At3g03770 isoform X1 [Tripterygium wilfordii]|uniref:probable inactive leucine-rich repeat receptor-like protein kinase At3g03770 isoform X1 n=1 Tax=Tripterygium wilfordii TaxID=458696 RepID=UPI0018F85C8D|nr:probable inactive leucine-rich repeat receptor-like protein kinase At3g03770 isoform X1 [Tripterygium wilfordii]XP_038690551.1 probable inactive leucine-rich repeat receptor-like protein kinase At3g03770 isoform X1 [Tripterygium wilfordii]XP_038690552.1 probable inactive leucine-rich repeat receptor-like protein kinase At3g03770 isoform X1 [Tripterygium wilfordii]XP_038690553.1 probable inactive leucine-rich repeat receptor-like protein kinase At3g03770 isoform X1 [Tripterygium wilfordii]